MTKFKFWIRNGITRCASIPPAMFTPALPAVPRPIFREKFAPRYESTPSNYSKNWRESSPRRSSIDHWAWPIMANNYSAASGLVVNSDSAIILCAWILLTAAGFRINYFKVVELSKFTD